MILKCHNGQCTCVCAVWTSRGETGETPKRKLSFESEPMLLKEKLIEDYSDLTKLLRVNNGVCKNAPIILKLIENIHYYYYKSMLVLLVTPS